MARCRLVLEFEEGVLPVGRVVGVDCGCVFEFCGWADLAGAIERARGARPAALPDPSPPIAPDPPGLS